MSERNNSICIRAHAKINLFLEVTSRRCDGYHSISTVMLSLSLCDNVTVGLRGTSVDTRIDCNRADIPCDSSNTAYRAAAEFAHESGLNIGADIVISKSIPSAAGLGGGSADAAAVLAAMNYLTGEPLDKQRLLSTGARIGADVPFCLLGGCIHAEGLGDKMIQEYPVPNCTIVIAKPVCGVSTPAAYCELDRLYSGFYRYTPRTTDTLLAALESQNIEALGGSMYNIFQQTMPSLCPASIDIRERLSSLSLGSVLSGSGSAVFALFRDDKTANAAADVIRHYYPDTEVFVSIPAQSGLEKITNVKRGN